MSTNEASLEAPQDGALWVVQVFGATLFLISGLAKVGDEQLIQTFTAIGVDQWFRYLTGLIEFASAILLLIPALSGIAALVLVPIMIGAILAHFLVVGGNPALPIGLLVIVAFAAWGRKETTLGLIRRNYPKSAREATNSFSEISQDPPIMVKDKKI
jgi:putative oxidoreductase